MTVLVNNNCEIDAFDKNHITPLIKVGDSREFRHGLGVVEALITERSLPPLRMACLSSLVGCGMLILNSSSRPSVSCDKPQSVQCWKQKCATLLLEHGADPNVIDSSGNSALHYAVYNGHEEMVALLLQYNANIEQKTKVGFTAFQPQSSLE